MKTEGKSRGEKMFTAWFESPSGLKKKEGAPKEGVRTKKWYGSEKGKREA